MVRADRGGVDAHGADPILQPRADEAVVETGRTASHFGGRAGFDGVSGLDPGVDEPLRVPRLEGKEKIALRVGKVIAKYKMAKHFALDITETAFAYRRSADAIAAEAALDGLYIVRTSVPATELDAEQTVRAYVMRPP